ncbi:hypothetical protein DB30_06950 [Enhygromyxa salina]|uniref:Uncharacterized protein n=1 Tax=Enhygromyxa salina TaxID=215803 RepID=A0A0C1ZTG3_9BACT|nr:hypothetical protein DB30_06950 [Enhygromyxa salina]
MNHSSTHNTGGGLAQDVARAQDASKAQDDARLPQDPGQTESRGPWTADEEEAICMLMELMPLLAQANEAAKRRRYREKDPLLGELS